jgi:hypothetical protein
MSPGPRRALVIVMSVCALALAAAPAQGASRDSWRDPSRSPAQRADALLAALTQADKIAIALNDFAPIAAAGGPSALPNSSSCPGR